MQVITQMNTDILCCPKQNLSKSSVMFPLDVQPPRRTFQCEHKCDLSSPQAQLTTLLIEERKIILFFKNVAWFFLTIPRDKIPST